MNLQVGPVRPVDTPRTKACPRGEGVISIATETTIPNKIYKGGERLFPAVHRNIHYKGVNPRCRDHFPSPRDRQVKGWNSAFPPARPFSVSG